MGGRLGAHQPTAEAALDSGEAHGPLGQGLELSGRWQLCRRLAAIGQGQALLDAFHFKVGVAGDPFSEGLELGEDRYALPGTDLKTITPDWHRAKSSAAGFAFLPLRIRGQAVGVIFAEQVVAGPRVWHLPEAAPLISTLRDSVVDALRRMKS